MTAAVAPIVQPMPEIEESTNVWPARAEAFEILSQEDYGMAAEALLGIKALQKEVKKACAPVKAATNAAHKAATQQENGFLAPLTTAERTFKGKMGTWDDQQEAAAREERRLIAAAQTKAEEELRLEKARRLEEEGKDEEADQVLETPIQMPIAPEPVAVKTQGISKSKKWSAQVTDMRAFLQGILDGKIPESAVEPNAKMLRQQATALQDQFKWPGVEVKSETVLSARG